MRNLKLYIVNPDRSVERHTAKIKLPDYLDTAKGRWIFDQSNIFDSKPLEEFESWDDFINWTPRVVPPRKPAALAIAGDVVPQAPTPMTDDDLAAAIRRVEPDAAQDLMTSVGSMDSGRSMLTWAAAGVLGVCSLGILVIILIAAMAFLGGRGEVPQPAELAPGMTVPAPSGTPWAFPTPPAPPTP